MAGKIKTVVILVHGYNVSNPEQTVNKLRPYFEELDCLVETFTYGHTNLFQVRWNNPRLAKRLAMRTAYWHAKGYQIIVVGHSNGCAIAHLGARNHEFYADVMLAINPALEKKLNPCRAAKKSVVLFNEGDQPVRWARRLSRIIPKSWFDARPWGEMGAVGYKGNCLHIKNIDSGAMAPKADGHSAVFHGKQAPVHLPHAANSAVLALPAKPLVF